MFPLRDSSRTKRTPYINIALIVINGAIFLLMLGLPSQAKNLIVYQFGLIPAYLGPINLISYSFLHGGWMHIISNMWYLWIFGDNIEDRLGHFNYLLFYLSLAAVSGMAQVYTNPASRVPVIGASGAVAGILGAYLITCPRSKVLALVPLFIFFTIIEIPAVIFLVFWFVLQLFNSFASIGVTGVMVAWWAHIGGFIAGLVLVNLFHPKEKCN